MFRLMRSASGGWLRRCRRGACRVTAVESIYHFDSTAGPNNVTGLHFNSQRGTCNGVVRSITYDIRLPFGA